MMSEKCAGCGVKCVCKLCMSACTSVCEDECEVKLCKGDMTGIYSNSTMSDRMSGITYSLGLSGKLARKILPC